MKKVNIKVGDKMISDEFIKTSGFKGMIGEGAFDLAAGLPIQVGSFKAQQKTQKNLQSLATTYKQTTGDDLTKDLSKYKKERKGGLGQVVGLLGGTLLGSALGGKVGGKLAGKFLKNVPGKKVTSTLIGANTTKEFGEIVGSSLGSNVASFADTAYDKSLINKGRKKLQKDQSLDPNKKKLLNQALDLQEESSNKYNAVDTIDLFTSPLIQHGSSSLLRKFKK
jgi:hypothetical protein